MKPTSFIRRCSLSPVVVGITVLLLLLLTVNGSYAKNSIEEDIDDEDLEVDTEIDDDDFSSLNYDDIPWDKLKIIASESLDEEPEHSVSEALGKLITIHEKATRLEKQYKDLERFQTYSEDVKKNNQIGKDTVDKIDKLGDRLETLMVDAKKGKMTAEQYKLELIDVDREMKGLYGVIDDFSDNATVVSDEWREFAEKWNAAEQEWHPFITEMKEVTKLLDIVRNASVRLVDIEDDGTKGFAGGREIDFDISVVLELKELFEELERLEDKETSDPKVFMKFIEEINKYQSTVIDVFLKANRDKLGRFMPSFGATVVRIKLNHMVATNVREVWEKHQAVGKQIYQLMANAHNRYKKIVVETAVVLKSVIKDEL